MCDINLATLRFVQKPIWQGEKKAKNKNGHYNCPREHLASASIALCGFHLFLDDHESIDAHRHDQINARHLEQIIDGREKWYGAVNEVLVPRFAVDEAIGVDESEARACHEQEAHERA